MDYRGSGVLGWGDQTAFNVDVAIYESRRNKSSRNIDLPVGCIVPESHNAAMANCDIPLAETPRENINDCAAFEEKIHVPSTHGLIDSPSQFL